MAVWQVDGAETGERAKMTKVYNTNYKVKAELRLDLLRFIQGVRNPRKVPVSWDRIVERFSGVSQEYIRWEIDWLIRDGFVSFEFCYVKGRAVDARYLISDLGRQRLAKTKKSTA